MGFPPKVGWNLSQFHLNGRGQATRPDPVGAGTACCWASPPHTSCGSSRELVQCSQESLLHCEGRAPIFSPYYHEVREALVLKASTPREFQSSAVS